MFAIVRMIVTMLLVLSVAGCQSEVPTGPEEPAVPPMAQARPGAVENEAREPHGWTWNDLGHLGMQGAEAWGINGRGQIVGDSYDESIVRRAFLYRKGTVQKLPDLPGFEGHTHTARAINAGGEIVGFVWISTKRSVALLWRDGAVHKLPPYGNDTEARAYDINASGTIAGVSWVVNIRGEQYSRPVVWEDFVPRLLPFEVNGHSNRALAMNNRGEVVGSVHEASNRVNAAHWDSDGNLRVLENLPGAPTPLANAATDINNRGWIVGQSRGLGALWRDGEPLELESFRWVTAVNNRGQIVGEAMRGPYQRYGAVWQGGTVTPLTSRTFCGGWNLSSANDINNAGLIVGSWDRPGPEHSGCALHAVRWDRASGSGPKQDPRLDDVLRKCDAPVTRSRRS